MSSFLNKIVLLFIINVIFYAAFSSATRSTSLATGRWKSRVKFGRIKAILNPTSTANPLNQSKASFLRFFYLVNVCHNRFQRCSKHLSPVFCANYTNQYNFYIWARKLAKRIMKGNDGIHCPRELLEYFLTNGNY